eukprot:c20660_g1_i1 orf=118-399(+)
MFYIHFKLIVFAMFSLVMVFFLWCRYVSTMMLTVKVDVYSFGVVLLEVVTGKMATIINASQQPIHIKEWIKPYIDCGAIDDIIDEALHKQYDA